MASRLFVLKGYDRDKYLVLKSAGTYCIGRGGADKAVDFKVDPCEYLTSRQHFFLDYCPPRFFVRDNNSTNGTLIQRGNSSIPVTSEQTELFYGDRVIAGNTVFRLEITEDTTADEAHGNDFLAQEPSAALHQTADPMDLPSDTDKSGKGFERMNKRPFEAGPFIGDPMQEQEFASADSSGSTGKSPEESKPSPPQDYYSVVVPEIQLFHSTHVKCIACGTPISVEITASELQAYGYPVFMCRKCSSGCTDEHNLKGLDAYRVLAELREDCMGLVYLARHEESGLLAEIRTILPRLLGEELRSVEREVSVIQSVSHPNLVRMYEYVIQRDRIYLIYEYMPEGDLDHYFKTVNGGSLSWNDACRVICDVLTGLRHCHEMGIVHGDIKPASILFKKDSRGNSAARLGDLGLAGICENTGLVFNASGRRETVVYNAPEFSENSRALKPHSDIYSIGIIFYYLLSGCLPFSDPSEPCGQMYNPPAQAGLYTVPLLDRIPDTPPVLVQIVEKAIRQKPSGRFQNASEMLQAILEMRL